MRDKNVEEKIADILLEKDIVNFSFNPPFVFTTGLKSPIFIDNRLLISYPAERSYVVTELVNLIREKIDLKKIDYISSSLSFAAPFGILISEALSLPLILIRETHTTYGRKIKIEGHLPHGKNVLVIEDHISTAAAVIDNVNTVREAGGKASLCVAVTDYEIDIAKKALKENDIEVLTILSGLPLVEEAARRNKITEKEKKDVLEWFEDPVKWGERRGYYGSD